MAEAFDRLLIGRTLAGRYEIQEVIGRGGMSVVYRGVDRTLGRAVAVKVIGLPADTEEARAHLRERFRREAGAAAQIPHHANVVQIYDYGTDPELDLDFIIMEMLVGRDLKEALTHSPPSPEEAVRVLLEAARGLAAGHRVGIVHRDVKPANFFLTGEERLESVRILDFGIAKPLTAGEADDLTIGGQLPHSPAYASPEQLDPGQKVTPASDVYQLGLIGYELLAGERPYSPEERERIRAGEEVPPHPGARWQAVPAPLRAVVEKALRPRPEDRYADAAEFAEGLAAAMRDEGTLLAAPAPPPSAVDPDATIAAPPPQPRPGPVAAPPPVSAPEPPRPAPPRPAKGVSTRALIAAGVVLLLALGVWGLTRGGGDEPADGPAAATAPGAPDDLDREFEQLETRASREQMKGLPPAKAEGSEGKEPENLEELQGSAAEVQRAIVELNDSWVKADMDRHMGFYADRVDFYACADCPKSRIRQERERDLRQYDQRRNIVVNRQAVTFPGENPDRALVLVDKEWEFVGGNRRRTGSGRQEMVLERQGGGWKVVSEKMREER